MSRPFKPPRLYLRKARKGRSAKWVIKYQGEEFGTDAGEHELAKAEVRLRNFQDGAAVATLRTRLKNRGRGVRHEKRWGYMYFITAADDETYPVKIGFTAGSISVRFANIQCCNPTRLKILCSIPCHRSLETSLHQKFAKSLIFGEWFKRCTEIEALIEAGFPEALQPAE